MSVLAASIPTPALIGKWAEHLAQQRFVAF